MLNPCKDVQLLLVELYGRHYPRPYRKHGFSLRYASSTLNLLGRFDSALSKPLRKRNCANKIDLKQLVAQSNCCQSLQNLTTNGLTKDSIQQVVNCLLYG